ncbi:vitamin K epoxide reductase family protein [Kitasatospora sp. NPDC002227]|uniref:vitamin K epoxide reductase family protein n=1 Tax=Kitasatospora sp. NPDC002227 TaxID=3154773 RepID=UPI00332100F9
MATPTLRRTPAPAAPTQGAARAYAWLVLVCGALGLAASAVLTVDKIRLLQNPAYTPGCNLNPVISCGSIMRTDQASAFGFPNSLIGLAAFGAVLAVGAGLLAGATYRRWFWICFQLGTLLGLGFTCWLVYQALYEIGALCPYCMVVWAAVLPLAWYTLLHLLGRRPRLHWLVPALWYVGIALLILHRFWYFWRTLP